MRRKHGIAADHEDHALKLAWGVAFITTLTVITILGLARSAQALTVPSPVAIAPTAAPAPPPDEEGEEEEEAGASEGEELEADACAENEECEEDGETGPEAPEECLLSSVEATVFASAAQDKIRLVVRYTASSATTVAVEYGLHGNKGSLYLGESRKRFSRTGVFRQTERLEEPQMAKAIGARDFTIQLYAVDAPRYCRHLFDRHLTLRHAAPSGLIWTDPESSSRSSRWP